MSTHKNESILEVRSTLPLVPYFSNAGSFDKAEAYSFAREHFVASKMSLVAVASVLQENYQRRIEEAEEVSRSLRELYFDDDATFKLGVAELVRYTEFREVDSVRDATIGERVNLFLDSEHPDRLLAYEIFARSREDGEDFQDISFAAKCLSAIAGSNDVLESKVHTLPKLTRNIQLANGEQRHVVMGKTDVGSFVYGDETIGLKNRQAGIMNPKQLAPRDLVTIDTLVNYNRSLGRTEQLLEARSNLQDIIEQNPHAITPVVGSIYLTRMNSVRTDRLESFGRG